MKPDEAAVYWIVLRDSRGLGQAEAAAFEAWLARDTNRQAYRQVLATWTALDGARV
jgi:ferric-dicitrate binding protein FerR (iron transport regulator)